MPQFDVVIIGAGVAGGALGTRLTVLSSCRSPIKYRAQAHSLAMNAL